MKKLILLLFLIAAIPTAPVRAQSTYDLIQQLLMDVKKLETLKDFLSDMYKGYEILDKGYTEIKDLAQGRFDLHKTFLDALLKVSPTVRGDSRIDASLDAAYNLADEYRQGTTAIRAAGVFTGQEQQGFDDLYFTIYQHSQQSLNELTLVMTDGQLRMTDAQRLRAIGRIYADIGGQLRALRQLNREAALQILQRQHEKNEIKLLKEMYGNP